jgi:hypothetical protein
MAGLLHCTSQLNSSSLFWSFAGVSLASPVSMAPLATQTVPPSHCVKNEAGRLGTSVSTAGGTVYWSPYEPLLCGVIGTQVVFSMESKDDVLVGSIWWKQACTSWLSPSLASCHFITSGLHFPLKKKAVPECVWQEKVRADGSSGRFWLPSFHAFLWDSPATQLCSVHGFLRIRQVDHKQIYIYITVMHDCAHEYTRITIYIYYMCVCVILFTDWFYPFISMNYLSIYSFIDSSIVL